jgi:hypothetical protein
MSPRFTIGSLNAIADWIKEDMVRKREVLKRRQEDFESFIASLKADKHKPEIHYFEGEEGIRKAYAQLFDEGKEILQFKPMDFTEEEDPLKDFFAQWSRERRRRGIALRVIARNTPLGRRFQSRDAFESRKTVLVPEHDDQGLFAFEKVIVGHIVACFNHKEHKASFIRYPELTETERNLFETLWRKPELAAGAPPEDHDLLTPKTLKELAKFFISRRGVVSLIICILISSAVTYGFYRHNYYLNLQRIREKAMAIAATAAPTFSALDLEKIHAVKDGFTQLYKKNVMQLLAIRKQNPEIAYAYLMRKTSNPYYLEFIADADSMDIHWIDKDKDGIDDVISPGQLWLDGQPGQSAISKAFDGSPTADESPVIDDWGIWISGHAPIKDNTGKVVAVLGVDMNASDVSELNLDTFSIHWVFILIFLLLVFGNFVLFNRVPMRKVASFKSLK